MKKLKRPSQPTDFEKRVALVLLSNEEMRLISAVMRSTLPTTPVAKALADRLDIRVLREEANFLAQNRYLKTAS